MTIDNLNTRAYQIGQQIIFNLHDCDLMVGQVNAGPHIFTIQPSDYMVSQLSTDYYPMLPPRVDVAELMTLHTRRANAAPQEDTKGSPSQYIDNTNEMPSTTQVSDETYTSHPTQSDTQTQQTMEIQSPTRQDKRQTSQAFEDIQLQNDSQELDNTTHQDSQTPEIDPVNLDQNQEDNRQEKVTTPHDLSDHINSQINTQVSKENDTSVIQGQIKVSKREHTDSQKTQLIIDITDDSHENDQLVNKRPRRSPQTSFGSESSIEKSTMEYYRTMNQEQRARYESFAIENLDQYPHMVQCIAIVKN